MDHNPELSSELWLICCQARMEQLLDLQSRFHSCHYLTKEESDRFDDLLDELAELLGVE